MAVRQIRVNLNGQPMVVPTVGISPSPQIFIAQIFVLRYTESGNDLNDLLKEAIYLKENKKSDFLKGPVWKCIIAQALPLTIAQLVHLLYNVVDRIYLGHMGEENSLALTGVGLCFPIITLIMAFTALFGNGGVPLFSIARGRGDDKEAEKILSNSFSLLILSSGILMAFCYILKTPILYLSGASPDSIVFAEEYLMIYLIGTPFSMMTTGLNGYINAQGYPKFGMVTTVLGAVANIILDALFILCLGMGVSGAALATVISQILSALWVLKFLSGKKAPIKINIRKLNFDFNIIKKIFKLGTSNFIMQGTNCLVQIACNSTLQAQGGLALGDTYVAIMTVLNSVREICMLPVNGIVSGSQPVVSYNYGAKMNERVKDGIKFNTIVGFVYTLFAWIIIVAFPKFWFDVFSDDPNLASLGTESLIIYFFGFVFMALQFAGQSTFQALGDAKHAIFFSLLRKAIIVVPLTFLLPHLGFGVNGVFLAEPVSNVIGGLACYITMRLTVYKKL